jgi:hypothetical protein
MKKLLAAVLLVLTLCAQGQVYKWTDAKGVVHYSDRPPPKAEPTKVVTMRGGPSPETQRICEWLVARVPEAISRLRFGGAQGTQSEAVSFGAEMDRELREKGMKSANLKRFVSMLYAYSSTSADDSERYFSAGENRIERAQMEVRNACLGGRFGRFEEIKADPASAQKQAPDGSGTGFWIAEDLVATSWHVVENASSISVTTSDGRSLLAYVTQKDIENDLAVLSVEGAESPQWLAVASDEAGLGANVFTVGFPQSEILGTKPKFASGVISSRFGMRDDPRTYQISVPIQSGNSGGPLVDDRGQVIGVVAAKLNAAKVFQWTGDLPQNVNYAVKSAPLLALYSAPDAAPAVKTDSIESLAPQVEASVVLVLVHLEH